MKSVILGFILTYSSLANAENLQWNDLDLYNRYTLTHDITFENGIGFKAGQKFDMQDFIAGGVPIAYFEMHYTGCQNPDQTAELILVDDGRTIIGAELNEGCNLGLFIELKDFFNESIFTHE